MDELNIAASTQTESVVGDVNVMIVSAERDATERRDDIGKR